MPNNKRDLTNRIMNDRHTGLFLKYPIQEYLTFSETILTYSGTNQEIKNTSQILERITWVMLTACPRRRRAMEADPVI